PAPRKSAPRKSAPRNDQTRKSTRGLLAAGLSLCLAPAVILTPSQARANDAVPAASEVTVQHAVAVQPADEALSTANPLMALSDRFTEVADRVRPSVVFIDVAKPAASRTAPRVDEDTLRRLPPEMREFFRNQPDGESRPRPRQQIGSGSGWVWDANGHIITNAHVVKDATRVRVRIANGEAARAEVVGLDDSTDVAVLKVDPERLNLTPAERAQDEARQGQLVFAFGSPFRQTFSMSQGIVSGVDRMTGVLGRDGFEAFIQTDAAINPGNSGGPLTDAAGRVLGMNSAILSRNGGFAGIGFAIPLEVVEPVVGQLLQHGEVRRSLLGIRISDNINVLRSFGMTEGVVIEDVAPGTPAEHAGLQPGDVIVAIDGQDTADAVALRSSVAFLMPGTDIAITVVRDGERQTLRARVGAAPEVASAFEGGAPAVQPAVDALARVGLDDLRAVDQDLAEQLELDRNHGVFVGQVLPDSPAAAAGLADGSVILQVMRRDVDTPAELAAALKRHGAEEPVRLRIAAPNGGARFVVIDMPGED
ncbi:MAG: trypsin-like peptidase domain-containing protein, partial [Planctomycetota bacterium]